MDTSQWLPQPIGEIVTNSSSFVPKPATVAERKPRPQNEQALNCPRCNSTDTKFCYYNNYSQTQPRYFCKGCRRYWTEGGSLRNIPVGGGSRKNKRSSSSSSRKLPDLANPGASKTVHEGHNVNLGFPSVSKVIQPPADIEKAVAASDASGQVLALELLSGITSSGTRGLGDSFIPLPVPDPATVYGSGFGFTDFMPSLSFSLDLTGTSGGFRSSPHGMHDGSRGRISFPFKDSKVVSGNIDNGQQGKDTGDPTTGYWTWMLDGGSW